MADEIRESKEVSLTFPADWPIPADCKGLFFVQKPMSGVADPQVAYYSCSPQPDQPWRGPKILYRAVGSGASGAKPEPLVDALSDEPCTSCISSLSDSDLGTKVATPDGSSRSDAGPEATLTTPNNSSLSDSEDKVTMSKHSSSSDSETVTLDHSSPSDSEAKVVETDGSSPSDLGVKAVITDNKKIELFIKGEQGDRKSSASPTMELKILTFARGS